MSQTEEHGSESSSKMQNQNNVGTDDKSNHKKVEENMDCDGTHIEYFYWKVTERMKAF